MSACGQASCLLVAVHLRFGRPGHTRMEALARWGWQRRVGGPSLGDSSATGWPDGLGQVTCPLGVSVSSSAKSRGRLVNASQTFKKMDVTPFSSIENLQRSQRHQREGAARKLEVESLAHGPLPCPSLCLCGAPLCPNPSQMPSFTGILRLWGR